MTIAFHDFYTELFQGNHGTNVRNEPGCRPRGAFTRAKPGSLKCLFVLQNPYDPLPEEKSYEGGAIPKQIVEKLWRLTGDILEGRKPRSPTLQIACIEACRLLNDHIHSAPAGAGTSFTTPTSVSPSMAMKSSRVPAESR